MLYQKSGVIGCKRRNIVFGRMKLFLSLSAVLLAVFTFGLVANQEPKNIGYAIQAAATVIVMYGILVVFVVAILLASKTTKVIHHQIQTTNEELRKGIFPKTKFICKRFLKLLHFIFPSLFINGELL